jgi:acyl-CoA thioester hydrolase
VPLFEILRRVGYAETDQMAAAHHSRAYVWFEEARTSLMRDLGCPYDALEAAGYFFPVAEGGARYRSFARFDALLHVGIEAIEVRGASVRFEYVVRDQDRTLVEGFTEHACIDRSGKVRRMPKEVRAFFEGVASGTLPGLG